MKNNENREYLERIREEIEQYYNGFENEDGDEMSIYDYMSDVLDYEITIDSRLEYRSCKIWVTLGGPNVWIDTAEHEIKLAWGGERDALYLDSYICDEIDCYMEEIYNCR